MSCVVARGRKNAERLDMHPETKFWNKKAVLFFIILHCSNKDKCTYRLFSIKAFNLAAIYEP